MSLLPPHILILRVGAFIMLLRNLDPKNGLLNVTRLVVQQNFIDAEIITGSKKGERVFIPRLSLEPSESSLPFKMRRRQFPVILAFVNKAQGQSFEQVGVYIPEPVFGQCRRQSTLRFISETIQNKDKFRQTIHRNIVRKMW